MLADKIQHEAAVYLDLRQTLASWLVVDAGIRYDRHSHAGSQWVPQAGLSLLPSPNAELKLSASKGFRYPTIREMYMFPPQNPDLKPERLWNYEIAWSQRLSEGRVSYGINLFYIDGENLIMRIPVDGRPKNINTGRIANAGVEAQAGWRISPAWSLNANYSYLHMKYPVLASPEHKLYAGASFVKGRWNVSTGVQYVDGLYTEVKVNGNGAEKQERFVLWNLRGSFRVCKIVSIFVRGENLLAQRYEINAGYPMPKATVLGGIDLKF